MKDQIIKFWRDEEGATAIEYGLIAGLIAVGILATLTSIGTELKRIFGLVLTWRIQIRSATPLDSMNEGGMLRAVDQQFSVHSQR